MRVGNQSQPVLRLTRPRRLRLRRLGRAAAARSRGRRAAARGCTRRSRSSTGGGSRGTASRCRRLAALPLPPPPLPPPPPLGLCCRLSCRPSAPGAGSRHSSRPGPPQTPAPGRAAARRSPAAGTAGTATGSQVLLRHAPPNANRAAGCLNPENAMVTQGSRCIAAASPPSQPPARLSPRVAHQPASPWLPPAPPLPPRQRD